MSVKILAFSGSSRSGSYNQSLAKVAANYAVEAGAQATVLDLKDYDLPLFNQDLEAASGLPKAVQELKEMFKSHDGLLIASPEYNSSVTPLLKNTIDWISRAAEGEAPLAAYRNKAAGLVACSPGGLGGLRGLVHLRAILQNIGVTVAPSQLAVPKAFEAFDEHGQLKDENQQKAIAGIAQQVIKLAAALKS